MKSTTSTVTTSLLILITTFHVKVVMAHQYLRKYSWLSYSWQENSGYSFPCVLFARTIGVRKGKGVLVETAFTNFKKMYEVCDRHAAREGVPNTSIVIKWSIAMVVWIYCMALKKLDSLSYIPTMARAT